jgi:DSBA-like thioredoxin domain
MTAAIDFYFDFVSPYSYLASTILPGIAKSHAASINYRPFTLLELMQKVGNRPTTIECQNKGTYVMADLQRWAKRYQVHFAPNPFWQRIDFPELGRAALVAVDDGGAPITSPRSFVPSGARRPISVSVPSSSVCWRRRISTALVFCNAQRHRNTPPSSK